MICRNEVMSVVSTLILLYALNTSGDIPQGCFIAAWVLAAVELMGRFLMWDWKMHDKK